MKHIWKGWVRGAFAVIFAAAMVFSYAPAKALADDDQTTAWTNGTAEVSGLQPDDTVVLKKVATTEVDTHNVLQHKWVGTPEGFPTIEDYQAAEENGSADSSLEQYANTIAAYVMSDEHSDDYPDIQSTGVVAEGKASWSNLGAGLYLVSVSNENDASYSYQNTTIYVKPVANDQGEYDPSALNPELAPKGTAVIKSSQVTLTHTDKDTKGGGEYATNDINTVGMNEQVAFSSATTIPKYVGSDQQISGRTFTFTSTSDPQLSYDSDSIAVKTQNETLTPDTDYTVTIVNSSQESPQDNSSLIIKFNGASIQNLASTPLTISYTETVGSDAKAGASYTNKASLEFSKDSYSAVTNIVKPTTESLTINEYGLQVKLMGNPADEGSPTPIQFATFKIYKDGQPEGAATYTTNDQGVAGVFQPLGTGARYTIQEITSPNTWKLDSEAHINQEVVSQGDESIYKDGVTTVTFTVDPVAEGATDLPTTGGPGTIALTAVGVILMAGAIIWLIRSRKHEE